MPVATGIVDAPIEDVWAMVSNFGGLMRWHPHLTKVECDGSAVGAIRTATFADGRTASESLEKLDNENHLLLYKVTNTSSGAMIGMTGEIKLTKLGDRQTKVDWTSSGAPPEAPNADKINATLLATYTTRINNHLKTALGLTPTA